MSDILNIIIDFVHPDVIEFFLFVKNQILKLIGKLLDFKLFSNVDQTL
jgi:hypothetical protein